MKTLEEYKSAIKQIEEEAATKKQELARSFAFENAQYKVGDIIESRLNIIKVEKLKWGYGYEKPYIMYCGTQLKKDLTPKLRQSDRTIIDSSVLKKLN